MSRSLIESRKDSSSLKNTNGYNQPNFIPDFQKLNSRSHNRQDYANGMLRAHCGYCSIEKFTHMVTHTQMFISSQQIIQKTENLVFLSLTQLCRTTVIISGPKRCTCATS